MQDGSGTAERLVGNLMALRALSASLQQHGDAVAFYAATHRENPAKAKNILVESILTLKDASRALIEYAETLHGIVCGDDGESSEADDQVTVM
jgi:hypothetical protein